MLTPEMIRAMTTEERAQLFDQLAKRYYAVDTYAAKLAADFGIGKATAYRYAENDPPFAILLTLDAWLDQGRDEIRDLKDLPAQLAEVVAALANTAAATSRAAGTMSRAVGRLVKVEILPPESAAPEAAEP